MKLVEDYVTLGLRLGRHVDGLVDAYYGPPALADAVVAEEIRDPAALLADADDLLALLAEPEGLSEARRGWLDDQVRGLRTYASVLAGELLSYADEVEGCYGVRPGRIAEDEFIHAHERLDGLLPRGGSLTDRFEAWRTANVVPADRILEVMAPMLALLRERTRELVELPDDEEFALELVTGEPWAAFNYYLGGRRSRIAVNTELPFSGVEIVHLAAHEGYPGHHTEHAVKERLLIEERGQLEESIQLVPTPQALLSEGIAEVGAELVLDNELEQALGRILATAGLHYDAEEARKIRSAREPLGYVARNAALLVHDDGLPIEEAQAYVARWSLAPPHRAGRIVAFVVDPTWRAYVTTYTEGLRLCRAYVGESPVAFRKLLTQQVRVGELLAAAAGDGAVSSAP